MGEGSPSSEGCEDYEGSIGVAGPSDPLDMLPNTEGDEPELAAPEAPVGAPLSRTVAEALTLSSQCRIVTEATSPFRVVHVNLPWCVMTGYSPAELIGQTPALLHGRGTCRKTLDYLRDAVLQRQTFAVRLVNYSKQGRAFLNTIMLSPLVDDVGETSHYLGVSEASFLDDLAPPMLAGPLGAPNMDTGAQPDMDLGVPPDMDLGAPETPAHDLAEEPPPGDATARVPPFMLKLVDIVMSDQIEDLLHFNSESNAFNIIEPNRFAKEVPTLISPCPS